jgi:hypothetical protein
LLEQFRFWVFNRCIAYRDKKVVIILCAFFRAPLRLRRNTVGLAVPNDAHLVEVRNRDSHDAFQFVGNV